MPLADNAYSLVRESINRLRQTLHGPDCLGIWVAALILVPTFTGTAPDVRMCRSSSSSAWVHLRTLRRMAHLQQTSQSR